MAHVTHDLVADDIGDYLDAHEHKSLLRFITCGSVDDGKITLIGRLLYDSKLVFEDQLAALEADSKKHGTQGERLDFALLVDGLAAEREQGITIDVAYRFFTTDRRKFIVADTPGHEQYTRNMVTGASTADVAVILVDARKGVLTQTRRHSYHRVTARHPPRRARGQQDGPRRLHARRSSTRSRPTIREFADRSGFDRVTCIPISALLRRQRLVHSANTPWYDGPTLLGYLETVEVDDERGRTSRSACRCSGSIGPNLDFRGFSGTIVGGNGPPGRHCPHPARRAARARVARIVTVDGDLDAAAAGQSVTLTLADEVDVLRGDVLQFARLPAKVGDQFETRQSSGWCDEPLLHGRPYLLKIGTRTVGGDRDARSKYKIDVNTLEPEPATTLELNEIGVCNIALDRPIAFDPYVENRDTGGFILIDRIHQRDSGGRHGEDGRRLHPPGPEAGLADLSYASMEGVEIEPSSYRPARESVASRKPSHGCCRRAFRLSLSCWLS